MHILTDENNTPILHGHRQAGGETGTCSAAEQQCSNDGDCSSCQTHPHSHAHGSLPEPQTPQQMAAVLEYMLRHNRQHAAQLDQFSSKLMDMDQEESAMQLQKAVDEFSKGNLYLGLALSLLKGE